MRRSANFVAPIAGPVASLKPVTVLASACLALGACSGSGFWQYERDTFTLPGENPNRPVGSSENFVRARNGTIVEPAPLMTEAGDIWPGPSTPVPTLKDLQKQQTAEVNGSAAATTLAPLPALPSLPGYEISSQDKGNLPPPEAFPDAVVANHGSRIPIKGAQEYKAPAGSAGGNIVVPNGNGTSTVISPTGQVSTIPTPK